MRTICKGDGRTTPEKFDPDVLAAFAKTHKALDVIFSAMCGDSAPRAAAVGLQGMPNRVDGLRSDTGNMAWITVFA